MLRFILAPRWVQHWPTMAPRWLPQASKTSWQNVASHCYIASTCFKMASSCFEVAQQSSQMSLKLFNFKFQHGSQRALSWRQFSELAATSEVAAAGEVEAKFMFSIDWASSWSLTWWWWPLASSRPYLKFTPQRRMISYYELMVTQRQPETNKDRQRQTETEMGDD